eukprot:TRINITY_DN4089_c0_g1_i1.p1 TRINITY_DN4089_c0_g1~~TRINITY_DN4089_c0_g1_i1.p1  ORF type:complete len:220 (-),score=10.49 TRINITY_DN4089_c0_g1_i1:233-892(-)
MYRLMRKPPINIVTWTPLCRTLVKSFSQPSSSGMLLHSVGHQVRCFGHRALLLDAKPKKLSERVAAWKGEFGTIGLVVGGVVIILAIVLFVDVVIPTILRIVPLAVIGGFGAVFVGASSLFNYFMRGRSQQDPKKIESSRPAPSRAKPSEATAAPPAGAPQSSTGETAPSLGKGPDPLPSLTPKDGPAPHPAPSDPSHPPRSRRRTPCCWPRRCIALGA